MKTLDLYSQQESEIKIKISKFPDGQQTAEIVNYDLVREFSLESFRIISPLSSFNDLEIIICVTAALRELDVKDLHLYVPYFLGARSDRKFKDGGINYIKSTIAPIINLQKYDSVTVFDPHSDVLEACIDRFQRIENYQLISFALFDIYKSSIYKNNNFNLVSPDAGALKKIFNVAEKLNHYNEIIIAAKHRDIKTGKITHTSVPGLENTIYKDFIIIDDICDGGRTFIEIAKVIKKRFPDSKIYLIISHGIFSKGVFELSKYFEKIYTTNSICTSFTRKETLIKEIKITN